MGRQNISGSCRKISPIQVFAYIIIFIGLILLSLNPTIGAQSTAIKRALILYDSTGENGWRGQLYSISLRNLLGHFPVAVASKEVERYTAGELKNYDVVFYIGAIYDNELPSAFLKEVLDSPATVCWLGYNFWQVAWNKRQQTSPALEKKYGFRLEGLRYVHYPQVLYKGFVFTRKADPAGFSLLTIADHQRVTEMATFHQPDTLAQVPYIIRSANLWFVADNPFSCVTISDRYLIFADLLHDILGIKHNERHRALVRIEDVHGLASPEKLCQIADFLHSEGGSFFSGGNSRF